MIHFQIFLAFFYIQKSFFNIMRRRHMLGTHDKTLCGWSVTTGELTQLKKMDNKYVNCKRGGVQSINFGRYGECCKDKPICEECINKCFNKCPFCNCHPLHSLKNKFKQKKASFAVRKERLKLKMLRKIKNKLPILRVSVRRSRRIRHVDISAYVPPVYVMDRTPWIESSLWRRRVI